MNTIDEMIEVLQHKKNGGEVECEIIPGNWKVKLHPVWNFRDYRYRPKPEPIECWINVFASGTKIMCDSKEDADKYEGRTVFMREIEK